MRLHVDDLAGHLLGGEQPWVHLNMPAIAVTDERWVLSNGRAYLRRKGQALAPAIEGRRQLYERMLDIGAYNFGAQYQQAPFEHMNDEGMLGGGFMPEACFQHDGPDDEWGFPTMCFGKVAETAIMAHEVFGVGEHHLARPARDVTMDEFERYSRWCEDYQQRLQDDPAAEFGPPEGETWPPEPARLSGRRAGRRERRNQLALSPNSRVCKRSFHVASSATTSAAAMSGDTRSRIEKRKPAGSRPLSSTLPPWPLVA